MDNMDILNKVGLKVTKTRKIILEIFNFNKKILNVSEVYELCKKQGVDINISTVYRICETFFSKKILDKVVNNNRISGYKISVKNHVHKLSCDRCDKIIEINCPFNILRQFIEGDTGFTLTQHDIDIRGFCSDCKEKS